ncbi:MAG: HD domain-containing phosphohydrolase [Solirubrobacteraceae bacterium]|jgi:putative two-component system response regulator
MSDHDIKTSQIVIAGAAHACELEQILALDGYAHVCRRTSIEEVRTLCREMRADLLLLEPRLGECDGFELIEQLAPEIRASRPGVIVVSSAGEPDPQRMRALAGGVRDFIGLPIDARDVSLRIRNALTAGRLEAELTASRAALARSTRERDGALARAHCEVLSHLGAAAELRDDDTGEHTARVGRTAAAIAAVYGLEADTVQILAAAAPLHDIGKIGIPDQILLKRGPLTRIEAQVMRTHTEIGAAILSDSDVPEIRMARAIALRHHERWDGSGYPDGLSGVSIPFAARIVAIADVFDALVFPRPYADAWSVAAAVSEIASQRGRQFDAHLTDAFMRLDHEPLRKPIAVRGAAAARLRSAMFSAAGEARPGEVASMGSRASGARPPVAVLLPGRPR